MRFLNLALLVGSALGGLASSSLAQFSATSFSPGLATHAFGSSVAFIGDCDGDGVSDFAVGCVGLTQSSNGFARLISGATGATLFDLAAGYSVIAGAHVAPAGDVDGDQRADILVYTDTKTNPALGSQVTIYSGATGLEIRTFSDAALGTYKLGSEPGSMSAVGDLDLDGFVDAVIGSPLTDVPATPFPQEGRALVLSGATGGLIAAIDGTSDNETLGWAVCPAGDVNHDGVPDFATSSPLDSIIPSELRGSVSLYNGATRTPIRKTYGAILESIGYQIVNAGDVDLDGTPDIAATANSFEFPPLQPSARVIEVSGATGARLVTMYGFATSSFNQIANAGDQNGDGVDDLLVGDAHLASYGAGFGAAHLYRGGSPTVLRSFLGSETLENLGVSVDAGHDTNGDGRPDLLVGAPWSTLSPSFVAHFESSCQTLFSYNLGCAGSGGFIPKLEASGCVQSPTGNLTLSVTKGLGGKLALLFAGFTPTYQPTSSLFPKCALLAFPTFAPIATLPLAGAGPGNGQISITFTLAPAQLPIDIYLQAICTDVTPPGYATSNGFLIGKPGT